MIEYKSEITDIKIIEQSSSEKASLIKDESSTIGKKFCTLCGHKLNPNDRFCGDCGNKIVKEV